MTLAGKRALVTGGSGEIGGAICRALADAGADVIVHAHGNLEAAETCAAHLREAGRSAEAVAFDISDGDAVRAALAPLLDAAPIQILVHAAGVHDDAPMAGLSENRWRRVVDVSLNGFFNVAQPILLPMMRTRWGRIVAISSISAILGNRGQTSYAAAKAGLHGAVRSLALEGASRGLTANVVAPGVIATRETERLFPRERIEALVPMKRAGTTEEVADLVAFLASDKAAYITGQVIAVGGGLG